MVKFLRVHPNATNKEVQEALSKLFKKEIDCISASISLGKNNSGDNHPKLMIARSSIGINDDLKQKIIEKQEIEQPWGCIREEMLNKKLKYYYENKENIN